MRSAAAAGEGDRLATYVDFPAVRESLKSQMQAVMVKRLQSDTLKDNPFAALGMAIAGGVINTFVDGMVTPESLTSMINSGRPKPGDGERTPAPAPATSSKPSGQVPRVARHYEGWDVFHVEMHDPDTDRLMVTLVLNREGWFGWKLKSLRVAEWTPDAMASREPKQGEIQNREEAERQARVREIQQQKEADRKAIDDSYRDRRAKERAQKVAEFNADPAKVLRQVGSLVRAGRFNEACGLVADFDGVVNDDLASLRRTIESKVGVSCSN